MSVRSEFFVHQLLCLAIHLQPVDKGVGDHVIDGVQRFRAVQVFEIDHPFFGFGQGVRLETAQGLQIVNVVTAGRHKALSRLVLQRLPPETEKEHAVLHVGQELLHSAPVA